MPSIDVDRLLDPAIGEFQSTYGLSTFQLDDAQLPAARELLATGLPFTRPEGISTEVLTVPGAPGDPEVVLRVHRPLDSHLPVGCIFFMHGGGLVMGTAIRDDERMIRWAKRFNCVAIAVEYRLAPETPYPGPLEDCYAGLAYVHQNASALGVEPERIGIGGASAGGGLAAGLALLARDRGSVPIAFQLLIYPMLDDRIGTRSSQWENTPVWNPVSNRYGWNSYLPGTAGGPDVPAYAAAARATDLAGLPPTYVMVGTLDGFVDEDIDYANRLIQAGVDTELHVYPGAPHGFDAMARVVPVARRAVDDIHRWLGTQLNPEQRTETT